MESLWHGFANANANAPAVAATRTNSPSTASTASTASIVNTASTASTLNTATSRSNSSNYSGEVAVAAPLWVWLSAAFGGIGSMLILLLLFAWYRGAFVPQNWFNRSAHSVTDDATKAKPPVTSDTPASWCYVGTDDSTRICVAVATPSACGDITTYSSQAACVSGK